MLEQDFEQSIGYWSHVVARAMERALNEELAQYGITLRQCQVLAWLALEKQLTQSQLAERMRIEPPTLVRILDRMEEAGWVTRNTPSDDRRKKLIRPTRRVKPVWDRILTCIRSVRAEATQGIDADDLETARRVLSAMHANLHAVEAIADGVL